MRFDRAGQADVEAAKCGDAAALDALMAGYQPLLRMLAARMLAESFALKDELVQAGNLGLLQAISHYDANRGVKLSTYAVPWILGEMKRALRTAKSVCVSLDAPRGEDEQPLSERLPGCGGVDVERMALRMALQRLPKQEQTLISLRYFRGWTQAEAARLMHKSQAQISRIERHALDCLHESLMA